MNVSDAIRQMIKSKGLFQKDVAARIGKKYGNMSMYLKSEEGLRLENLLKITDACGYDVVLEDRSGNGNRFVLGNDRPATDETVQPTAEEERLFKAFLEWYRSNYAHDPYEEPPF